MVNKKHVINDIDRDARIFELEQNNKHLLETLNGVAEDKRTIEEQNDILMQLAHDMENQRNKADGANKAKSDFLAMMSHELRTPLNAIIGFSDILKGEMFGSLSERYRDYSNDINESGLHLLSLINDILDLSKIESGKDKAIIEKIDIDSLITSCNIMISQKVYLRKIRYNYIVADDMPLFNADIRKMKQIIVNILSNAIKFTPEMGKVTLETFNNQDGDFVFKITDTGIGIDKKDLEILFTPFQQIDSEVSRKYEGTGLGLALTKSLIELHNGTINISSEPGVGTEVTVVIPQATLEK